MSLNGHGQKTTVMALLLLLSDKIFTSFLWRNTKVGNTEESKKHVNRKYNNTIHTEFIKETGKKRRKPGDTLK